MSATPHDWVLLPRGARCDWCGLTVLDPPAPSTGCLTLGEKAAHASTPLYTGVHWPPVVVALAAALMEATALVEQAYAEGCLVAARSVSAVEHGLACWPASHTHRQLASLQGATMSGHYDLLCPLCKARVGGCRCAAKDKEQRLDVKPCLACQQALKTPTASTS